MVEKYSCSLRDEDRVSFFEDFYANKDSSLKLLDNATGHVGDCTVQLETTSDCPVKIYARGESQAKEAKSALEKMFKVELLCKEGCMMKGDGLGEDGLPIGEGVYLIRGLGGEEVSRIDVYMNEGRTNLCCFAYDYAPVPIKDVAVIETDHIPVQNTGLEFIGRVA